VRTGRVLALVLGSTLAGPSVCSAATTTGDVSAITIENTGSTNAMAYRIVVQGDGETSYVGANRSGHEVLPDALLAKLKYDVMMAEPLSHVRTASGCMKPASFGSSIFISLGHERSPDLSCPAGPKGAALKNDVEQIATFLKLGQTPPRPGAGVLPGEH